jgi:hypothetical protein
VGKRSATPETNEDVARLSLRELNAQISRARRGYELSGSSQGCKAFFKRLVWLEAERESLHGVVAPKRRFNSN